MGGNVGYTIEIRHGVPHILPWHVVAADGPDLWICEGVERSGVRIPRDMLFPTVSDAIRAIDRTDLTNGQVVRGYRFGWLGAARGAEDQPSQCEGQ